MGGVDCDSIPGDGGIMKQNEHLFQFTGEEIAKAAGAERVYHLGRLEYWTAEQEKLIAEAKNLTAIVRVEEQAITGGKRIQVVADIAGVQIINWKLQEAGAKITFHREKADEYHLKSRAYSTQMGRPYELDPADVAYFRLAGGERTP